MRSALLLLLVLTSALARAGEVEFVRIWPDWRNAEDFDRISEYFNGRENTSGQTILRTHPADRAGYYFLSRVKSQAAQTGAKFVLTVIRPDSPDPQVYSFSTALAAGESVVQLGLTGPAWPGGKKAQPVAWKLALLGANGQLIVEHKSFLWEMPAK